VTGLSASSSFLVLFLTSSSAVGLLHTGAKTKNREHRERTGVRSTTVSSRQCIASFITSLCFVLKLFSHSLKQVLFFWQSSISSGPVFLPLAVLQQVFFILVQKLSLLSQQFVLFRLVQKYNKRIDFTLR